MKRRSQLAIIGALLVTACAPTMSVYGLFGDEVYTGTTSGQAASGEISLSNGKGKTCIGERRGVALFGTGSGHGVLTCSDGTQAIFQYTQVGHFSGYGFGKTSTGEAVRFTFGLTPEESTKYLGQQPAQAAAATPGAPTPPTKTRPRGTGFFITQQGHLLTNAHVVEKCKELTVASPGGTASSARVVAIDKTNDLAVLQSNDRPAAIASLRGARPVRLGETVVAYGFPMTGTLSSDGVLTSGSVSASSGMGDDTRYFQISVPIQPGNSGGALLDSTGAVIGITSSGLNALYYARKMGTVPQNANFAIKASVIRTFLESVGISAETATGNRDLSMPDIGARARAFTLHVECKG